MNDEIQAQLDEIQGLMFVANSKLRQILREVKKGKIDLQTLQQVGDTLDKAAAAEQAAIAAASPASP